MKIGIDTFGCDHARSGAGNYLRSLTLFLPQEKDVNYELFGTEMDRFSYKSEYEMAYTAVNVPDSIGAERFWHNFALKKLIAKQNYDVVLYPVAARNLPLKIKYSGVAVVNDIVSSQYEITKDKWYKKLINKGFKNITQIIAASNFIKNDLIQLGINETKIQVIYNGLDNSLFFQKPEVSTDIIDISPFAIKRPYFIYSSSIHNAQKKHIELIKAFELFKEKTHLPHRLVLSGINGAYTEKIKKFIFLQKYAADIFITGYFPHSSLPALYAGAEACIFPSVCEGVGFPVIEAMAVGIPVACSKSGALPEITGGNALFFDSDNIEDIELSMEKIIIDKKNCEKNILQGLKWVKQFNWENTANKTVEVLKKSVK